MAGYKRKRPVYKKAAARKSYRKPKARMNLKKMMKKVVLKVIDTKRLVTAFTKVEMFHYVFSTCAKYSVTAEPGQRFSCSSMIFIED